MLSSPARFAGMAPRRPIPRVRPDLVAAVVGAVASGLLFLLAHRSLIDDAYITLTYARNVAFHLHWGVIEQQTSNTATSPLNVWLLAAVTMLVRQPVVAVGVILMATSAAAAVWSARTARQAGVSWVAPVLTVFGLLASPLLGLTIGLETFIAASLVIGLAYYAVLGRPVAAGLLVLTRPDLVVFAAVAVLGVAALRRQMVLVAGIAVLVVLPWHLISWVQLGSALPDTFLLKTGGEKWGDSYDFANGWQLYGQAYPTATVLAAGPAVLGLLCLAAWMAPALRRAVPDGHAVVVVTGIGGLAHLAAFAALGTAPYHWYYGPSVAGLTCCAAFTAATQLVTAPRRCVGHRTAGHTGDHQRGLRTGSGYAVDRRSDHHELGAARPVRAGRNRLGRQRGRSDDLKSG